MGAVIAKHRNADHDSMIQPVGGDVVLEHALGEIGIVAPLNFNVNEQPAFFSVTRPHLEQLIGQAFALLGLPHDLLKLVVERFVAARPIDVPVNIGKIEHQEEFEELLQRVLPGAVEIVGLLRRLGMRGLSSP